MEQIKKKKTSRIEKKVLVALYGGDTLIGWYGGDGTRIPVWELEYKEEAQAFLKHNKFHKPKLAIATIII